MTKTIRMLLVFLLTAGLLLSGASALAEKTGTITFTVPADAENGFTNLEGIEFEIYRVGKSVDTGTAWEATSDFSTVDFTVAAKADASDPADYPEGTWGTSQVKAMIDAIEGILDGENPPKPLDIANNKTNATGSIVFSDLEAGIYYIRKVAESRPQLLKVQPSLIAVPTLSASDPYNLAVTAKREYEAPGKTSFTVNKVWDDDSDFDGAQPESITVHLHRTLDGVPDTAFAPDAVTLNAANNWSYPWTDLEARDENGKLYAYSVTEDDVTGYTGVPSGGTITNTHPVEYGAIRVTKAVLLNGQATTGKLADGTYKFSISGPAEADYTAPKKKNDQNYLSTTFEITVTDGRSSSWTREKLMPGTYVIREDTSGLPSGMSVVGSAEQTIVVQANTTATNPAEVTFTNNRVTGSLKITKTVTVNGSGTGRTLADGTYRFIVTGPSYPGGETVSIKIKNGKSNSVQLDNLLLGEYSVEEVKTGMPSGVSYVSGDGKKTLAVTNTAAQPLTFAFVNNRTVTNPPSEARPTPTPRGTPTPTPVVTPTPTPTPTPEPAVNISGQKIWRDKGNAHDTRPSSIKVQLLRDGEQIREITVTGGAGNRWGFSFGTLPKYDETGAEYRYTVKETPVDGYTTSINGTTIVNELVTQTPKTYTSFNGNKIWKDDDNANGSRPNYITVRLMRDGREVDRRTVTAAKGWQYSFQDVPVDDGYGHEYSYAIREDAVAGYVGRVEDFIVTNSRLPAREKLTTLGRYGTPLAGFGEPELEGLLELYDYGTPLWGRPLKTGDELPLYPIVFGGIGGAALIALCVLTILNKKRKNNAA